MKVLIVDDMEEGRYLLEALLTGNGYEVVSAINGAEALEKLRADGFDMIVSDVLMPVMDGFQLCHEVRSDDALKQIPFVFYTAVYTEDRDEDLAMKVGADKFVRKPTEPDVFIKIIQGVARDALEGTLEPKKPLLEKEEEVFKLYNERLVAKLEKKSTDLEAEITERKKAQEALQERVKELTCLHSINREMHRALSREALCRRITQHLLAAMQFPEVTAAAIELDGMRCASEGYTEGLMHGLHTDIRAGEKAMGHLSVYYTEDRPFLIPEEQNLVDTIGRDLGLWLERVQAEENLKRALEATVYTLGQMAETRDPYTAGHQRRVSQLAYAIAAEMRLPEERAEGIRVVGLMHDIGKMSVPAEILTKPTRLTEAEFALIKEHPQVAYDLLKTIDFPWPVADIVLQHHERLDGSGYPKGLKEDEILLEARILAVADVVEAMSSHRPYRPALGIDEALAEIKDGAGTRYDASVVEACTKLFESGAFAFSEAS